jgi:thioredoxin reductase (NADPH)
MQKIKTQLLIIGSGPAGLTAAIYAARAALKTVLLCGMQPGGQLTITTDVENYPGFANPIEGPWLMEQMTLQAKHVGAEIIYDYVKSVNFLQNPFIVTCASANIYEAESVIIATGATAKWLNIPSEETYKGFGVSACATCDGFFFKNKKIIVVGGGNSAVEEALYLTNHASEVILIHRKDSLRAEKILQERLFKNPKISIIWNHEIDEIIGVDNPKTIKFVKIKNILTNEIQEIRCEGVFIAIGHKPNTELFKDQIDIDHDNYIVTKPDSTKTNIEGIFAAGDVQDKIYRQAVTAAGTGCMAALEAEKFLSK